MARVRPNALLAAILLPRQRQPDRERTRISIKRAGHRLISRGSAAAISSHTKYHAMLDTSAAGDASNYVRVKNKCAGASNQ